MDLKIFDVEHGACALLKCDDNTRLMIDCGHNATTGWYPGTYLRQQNVDVLDMLAITNYDEDHVSGIANLCDNVNIFWLWRNNSVSATAIRALKRENGMGDGIARLVREINGTFTGDGSSPEPTFSGLVRNGFYHDYPVFDDENNLSLVIHLQCHGIGVLFPGDLEREGWLKLLEEGRFRQALRNTNVLVASHHGRESGCCEEIFEYCKPHYVVISDKGYMHDTQKTIPFYRRFAQGGPFRGEPNRQVLTTRNDGRIGFNFTPNGWSAY